MTGSRWTDIGDDELLANLGTALAPPDDESAASRLAAVVPLAARSPGRPRWVAAAVAVAVLGAGGAVAAQVGGGDPEQAPVIATASDRVDELAHDLEDALADGDHDPIQTTAAALRGALEADGWPTAPSQRSRIEALLDAADQHPAPPTTTISPMTTTVTAPAPTIEPEPDDDGCPSTAGCDDEPEEPDNDEPDDEQDDGGPEDESADEDADDGFDHDGT